MNNVIRAEVVRKGNENSMSLIRRFSRRAMSAAIVRTVRNRRFYDRSISKNMQQKNRLHSLAKRAKYEEDVKLGKIDPNARRTRGRRR
ncbi:30S ribosomal protein S21 [Candidatus Wolfebacteria bacterium]|nr:30S ribosomal protein S21 [Candidatus Wolfebacteria bacterium]